MRCYPLRCGLVAVAILAAGCAAPQEEASPVRLPELAATADPLPAPETTPAATATPQATGQATDAPASPTPTGPSTDGPPDTAEASPTGGAPVPSPTETASRVAVEPREIALIDDRTGDQGLEGPEYADLRRARLVDTGESLRIEISVGGPLPATLDEGEVLGLGIDLLREDDGESSYQVFVDGGSDGWRAYFQTRAGFVAFPGTFELGGARVVLTIPWASIGHPPEGPWRVFLDWSAERLLLNAAASDRVPDNGTATFQRG